MSSKNNKMLRIVMLGATGAVGGHAAQQLLAMPSVGELTCLGRRPAEGLKPGHGDVRITQHQVDVMAPQSYEEHLPGHDVAICCLGVGEPSKVSREQFVRIDKDAALGFAGACRRAGVRHFELLSSVGTSENSASFYLRTKGELEAGLRGLSFDRLSIFHPSMILTPENRYGLSQALTLAVWPKLSPILSGPLRKFRGIRVEELGQAIALNICSSGSGEEHLHWDQFRRLTSGT